MRCSNTVPIDDASAVGEARRFVQGFAHDLGFDVAEAGNAALLATELAGNIVKHAGRGEIVLRRLAADTAPALELLALDRGPGMENVAQCLRDGYSTAGSPGTGLGAVSRLAHDFDIYSARDMGTAVLARLWNGPGPRNGAMDIAAVCLPKPGQEYCGDGYAANGDGACRRVLVADGLGHGPLAAEASEAAIAAFVDEESSQEPEAALSFIHHALRGTRGAAVAMAVIDFARGVVRYAGVGNIAGCIVTPGPEASRRLVSQNGTAGVAVRKIQQFSYPWPRGAHLVMNSDGLATQWLLTRYPGLLARDPALIAGVLYRDYRRGTDDVTVLVARDPQPRQNSEPR